MKVKDDENLKNYKFMKICKLKNLGLKFKGDWIIRNINLTKMKILLMCSNSTLVICSKKIIVNIEDYDDNIIIKMNACKSWGLPEGVVHYHSS